MAACVYVCDLLFSQKRETSFVIFLFLPPGKNDNKKKLVIIDPLTCECFDLDFIFL